ncbi:MAG: Rne/Rng family ribonuclease [Fusobacteriaceae bacterium]
MKKIVISKDDFGYKAAVLEDEKVIEILVQLNGDGETNGNIYKGKVSNVLNGIGAAFVDIGLEKNSFLYLENMKEFFNEYPKSEKREGKLIGEFIKAEQQVIVQAINEPQMNKGVRVSTEFNIPGKLLVLMPDNNNIAISKKITNVEERMRLEKLILEIKPDNMGVIIRTEAASKTVFHFEREMAYLINKWRGVEEKIEKSKVGDIVYNENDLITKICRDIFNSETKEIIINNRETYWEILNYLHAFGDGDLKRRVRLCEEEEQDIFDRYNITQVIESIMKKDAELKCGGNLVIQTTEALTSIDVNTARNIGKSNLEETIFNTNMEAAEEIPRQLALRNIGGIIIIDFIDMKNQENKTKVLEQLEKNLKKDRVKNSIVHFTDLSLVEMTRKRVGNPTASYFKKNCPVCNGTGKIKSQLALMEEILKECRTVVKDKDFSTVIIKINSELYLKLKEEYLEYIKAFLDKKGKKLKLEKFKDFKTDRFYEITLEK